MQRRDSSWSIGEPKVHLHDETPIRMVVGQAHDVTFYKGLGSVDPEMVCHFSRNRRSHRMVLYACSPGDSDSRPDVLFGLAALASGIISTSQRSCSSHHIFRYAARRGYGLRHP